MKIRSLLSAVALTAATTIPAHAALVLRGANNDMVYDTVSNLTWVRNASIGGDMDWASAKAWAENLVFAGLDDWRLPGLTPVNGVSLNLDYSDDGSTDAGINTSGLNSELGFLYYQSLGNEAFVDPVNAGLFQGLQGAYWTGTESTEADYAMAFFTAFGDQGSVFQQTPAGIYAWAVRAGDVPEPASLALVAAALGGLAFTRRKTATTAR